MHWLNGCNIGEQGDIEGAKSTYLEAVDADADCCEAKYNLGLTYRKMGLLSDAMSAFKQLSKVLPNNVEILFQVQLEFINVYEAHPN